MQDRYAGDVGDFGKIGLLRALTTETNFSLGLNWYLHPDEGHNGDGRFVDYLNNKKFERCDSDLCNKLRSVVETGRCVTALENAELFTVPTSYCSTVLDFYSRFPASTRADKLMRLSLRENWIQEARVALAGADVLFLDPDNGLEVASCRSLSQKKSGKYAYFDEIRELHKNKQFTVIYHHLNRHKNHGDHSQQIRDRAAQLKQRIDTSHTVFALRYKPYSPRVFFIVSAPSAVGHVEARLSEFMSSHWQAHWDNYHRV